MQAMKSPCQTSGLPRNIWTPPPTQCHSHCVDPLLLLFPRPVLNASRQPTLLLNSGPTISESDCCRQSISLNMKSFHYAEPQHSSTFQLKNPLRRHGQTDQATFEAVPGGTCYPLSTTKRLIPSESSTLNWRCIYCIVFSRLYAHMLM